MIFGKSLNAGQICVAPDYVLLPRSEVDNFIAAYRSHFSKLYPQGLNSADYGAIINDRQYQRLVNWLDEAEQGGRRAPPLWQPGAR